jgi:hypothetical protein
MRITADARIGIGLGVFVLLAVLLSLGRTYEDPDEPEIRPLRSTYRARPSGLRALYLTLEQLGYRPRRLHESPERLKENGALVIAEPQVRIASDEWRAIARWVERGNLLLLYSDTGHLFEPDRPTGNPVMGASPVSTAPVQPVPVAKGAATHVVRSGYRLSMGVWGPWDGSTPPPGPQGTHARHWSEGVGGPETGRGSRSGPSPLSVSGRGARGEGLTPSPVIPLYADGTRPVLGYSRWGDGVVILSCSPWSLSNEGVARGNNLALFLNLVDVYGAGKRRPIFFDEYHLEGGGGGGAWSLVPPVARIGVWQVVGALLLLVFALSRRFGPMIPTEIGVRRARTEYLTAMTGLFRRARALELAAAKLRDETQRDLARALGLPPTARPEEIARAAQEKRGVEAARVQGALDEIDHLAVARARKIPIDEGRVLAAASRLYDLRREVAGR